MLPGFLGPATLLSNMYCQLYVPWLNGDSFCMNGSQFGVFKQTNQIGLKCLLQGQNGSALKPQTVFFLEGFSRNFSYQSISLAKELSESTIRLYSAICAFLEIQVVAFQFVMCGFPSSCHPLYISTV
jgi:hypothetical protein